MWKPVFNLEADHYANPPDIYSLASEITAQAGTAIGATKRLLVAVRINRSPSSLNWRAARFRDKVARTIAEKDLPFS